LLAVVQQQHCCWNHPDASAFNKNRLNCCTIWRCTYTKDKRAFPFDMSNYMSNYIGDTVLGWEGSKDDSVVCHSTTIADDDDDDEGCWLLFQSRFTYRLASSTNIYPQLGCTFYTIPLPLLHSAIIIPIVGGGEWQTTKLRKTLIVGGWSDTNWQGMMNRLLWSCRGLVSR
jgi:hypothetical protein